MFFQEVFSDHPKMIAPIYFLLYILPVILPAVILVTCSVIVAVRLLVCQGSEAIKKVKRNVRLSQTQNSSNIRATRKRNIDKQVAPYTSKVMILYQKPKKNWMSFIELTWAPQSSFMLC